MRLSSKVRGVGFGNRIARLKNLIKNNRGEVTLIDWIKGIIVLAILGVGVAIPIVVNTVQNITVNDTTTQLILTFIPPILAVSILLGFLGR